MKTLGMLSITLLVGLAFFGSTQAAQKSRGIFTNPSEAGPDYQIQGEYTGEIKGHGKFGVQVVALGDGKFDVYFLKGGLPGAGWNQKDRTVYKGATTNGHVEVIGKDLQGQISDGKFSGELVSLGKFAFAKVERKSPTIGAPAPRGAIILFEGKSADQWSNGKIVEENLLHCGTRSREKFGLGKYHIEFRTPFRPKGRGQGRGNSGVYIMGREIQVLDSFGLEGKRNECGAYYGRAQPMVNMCFPPLTWQTFDVELKADDKGQVIATVFHNGVKIHDNFPIGRSGNQGAQINLQNHGNPVVFRNMWFVPAKN